MTNRIVPLRRPRDVPDVLDPRFLRQLSKDLKPVVGRRLVLSPSAELLNWIASTAYGMPKHLTNDQWCVVLGIAGWTLCRGEEWLPADGVSLDQLREALKLPPHQGSKTIVSEAVAGAVSTGILLMARGRRIKGNPNWYRFPFVDIVLGRPNLWHQNDPENEPDDQEECDRLREVLAAVDEAALEREQEHQVRLAAKWAGQRRHPRVHVGVELELPGVEAQS